MKIVVTGAGFLGTPTAVELKKRGHEALVIGRSTQKNAGYIDQLRTDGIAFKQAEVFSDELGPVLKDFKPEVVIHTAGIAVNSKDISAADYNRANVLGTLKAIEASKEAGVKSFVFMSTAAVYGAAKQVPIEEKHPAEPTNMYGASKLAGEFITNTARFYGMNPLVFRLFNIVGYGQMRSIDGDIMNDVSNGKSPMILGTGKQTRDFVSIHDVVRALVLGAEKQATGVYNVGSGKGTSINELAQTIIGLYGNKVQPSYKDSNFPPGYIMDSYCSIEKIKRDLGWTPQVSLSEALGEIKRLTEQRAKV